MVDRGEIVLRGAIVIARLLAAAQVSVQKQDANLGHKHKQRTG
jgi:hypothetical protein